MTPQTGFRAKQLLTVGSFNILVFIGLFVTILMFADLSYEGMMVALIILFPALLLVLAAIYAMADRAIRPFEDLRELVLRITRGNLDQTETERLGSVEARDLARSINAMTQTIQDQVLGIKSILKDILNESRELSEAMTALSSSSAEQAAAVAQTATTVTEMEKAAKNAAANANQIAEAAEKTAETSIRGRRAVETTNQIILQIKDDSKEMSNKSKNLLTSIEEVGNIIGFVNSIAEQSKILAVNASIEAAKAGEYGAGFAVVAQEVRDLAQQSKEATLQTTETLTGIRKAIENIVVTAQSGEIRTEDSVKMIGNAGAIVNDLSDAIRENSQFANVIATNVNQQTIGLTQIATAIDQINDTAVQNQSISKAMDRSMEHMTDAIDRLSEFLDLWNAPGDEP